MIVVRVLSTFVCTAMMFCVFGTCAFGQYSYNVVNADATLRAEWATFQLSDYDPGGWDHSSAGNAFLADSVQVYYNAQPFLPILIGVLHAYSSSQLFAGGSAEVGSACQGLVLRNESGPIPPSPWVSAFGDVYTKGRFTAWQGGLTMATFSLQFGAVSGSGNILQYGEVGARIDQFLHYKAIYLGNNDWRVITPDNTTVNLSAPNSYQATEPWYTNVNVTDELVGYALIFGFHDDEIFGSTTNGGTWSGIVSIDD